MTQSISRKRQQYNWLASLRGIAAIGVVLTHFLPQIQTAYGFSFAGFEAITTGIIDIGKVGVALMFMISGYLTPHSVERRSIGAFAANRFIRLYPLYWLCILFVGVLFKFDGRGWKTVVANLSMLQVFMGQEDLVGVFWTLPIELLVYIGVVILVKTGMLSRRGWLKWIFAAALAFSMGLAVVRKYVMPSAPLAIGLLLSSSMMGYVIRLKKENALGAGLWKYACPYLMCILMAAILGYSHDAGHGETWYRYFFSYSVALLLMIVFSGKEWHAKWLMHIGNISYPLYLFQEIVFRMGFQNAVYSRMPGICFTLLIMGTLWLVSVLLHALEVKITESMPC